MPCDPNLVSSAFYTIPIYIYVQYAPSKEGQAAVVIVHELPTTVQFLKSVPGEVCCHPHRHTLVCTEWDPFCPPPPKTVLNCPCNGRGWKLDGLLLFTFQPTLTTNPSSTTCSGFSAVYIQCLVSLEHYDVLLGVLTRGFI